MFAQKGNNVSITAEGVNAAVGQKRVSHTDPYQTSKLTLPVPTATNANCMSINYPAPTTWTLSSYSYGPGNGYLNGTNIYGDKEKATYYDASASSFTKLNQVLVQFAVGKGSNLNKVVRMVIYDGTTGTPGAAIGSSSLTLGDIKSDIANNYYTSFVFPGGLTIPASKKFFTSVDMSALTWTTTTKDSLSIVSNTNGQTPNPSPTWERKANNTWYQYNTTGATTASLSLVMFPFLTNNPSVVTFSVSASTVCVGQSMTHDATGTNFSSSTPGDVLQWGFYGPVPTTTLQTNLTPSQVYTTPGSYATILEVVGGGCQVYDYVIKTFTVIPTPTVTATAPSTVCLGSSATLTGGGAVTYTWTGGITNALAFTPSSSGAYTVTGTGANGCKNTAITNITVANPTVTANASPTSICPGGNTTLTGGGASTYTWTGGVTNGVAFNPPSTSTYTVTGTDLNGCTNTASVTVSVVSSLTVTANSSAPAVCAGSSLTLTGGGASTYTWTSSVSDGVSFIPSVTNTYTVSGASGACTGSAVVTVSVNANPTVGANTTTTSVCAGNNITLTGSGATTYVWTGGATNATPFAPSASTVYTVTGTSNGCSGTATVGITVNTNPVVTASSTSYTVCAGNNITLTGAGATTYAWTGGITDGVAFTPAASTVYTVTGSNSTGCTSTATVGIMVSPCTGIEAITAGTYELTIYPNPNNGDFTIAVSGLTEKLSVEIFNGIGQLVYKEAVVSEKQAISTNLADGVYLIKLMDSNKVLSTKKLIKQ